MDRLMVAVAIGAGLVFCAGVIVGILVMIVGAATGRQTAGSRTRPF